MAWGVQGDSYEVNMDRLPGGTTGRFKIMATDGFHTVSAYSPGSLTVKDKPPTIALIRPDLSPQTDVAEENPNQYRVYTGGEAELDRTLPPGPVTFEAHGSDLEDGRLADDQILWFLGKQRAVHGQGRKDHGPFRIRHVPYHGDGGGQRRQHDEEGILHCRGRGDGERLIVSKK